MKVSVEGRPVQAQPADLVPYGYSAADLNGYIFTAEAGQRISATVASTEPSPPPGELVVLPVWRGYTVLDHANGVLVMQELSPYLAWAGVGGGTALLAGAATLLSERLRKRRLTTR